MVTLDSPVQGVSSIEPTVHVLHVIESLGPGGAERLLYTNLKSFGSRHFRHTVVTVFDREPYWQEPIERLGVDVIGLGCRRYADLGRGAWKFWSILRRLRPAVIHTHLWAADVVGRTVGRLAGLPVISSVHNTEYDPESRLDEARHLAVKRRAALVIDRWTAAVGVRRLIAVSETVRASASRHLKIPPHRIDLIHNAVDFAELRPDPDRDRPGIWAEAGIPHGAIVLLNVGRASTQKGLVYAVRALARIVNKFPQVNLVSVGSLADADYIAEVRAEADRLAVGDRLHFLGPRRDIPALLSACDLFLFPSLFEGLGIALIEAMAIGCACVASDIAPLREVVHDGHDGLLVSPRDADGLARAVCSLLGDPPRRVLMGQFAAAGPFQRFDPAESAARLAAIYRSVLCFDRVA